MKKDEQKRIDEILLRDYETVDASAIAKAIGKPREYVVKRSNALGLTRKNYSKYRDKSYANLVSHVKKHGRKIFNGVVLTENGITTFIPDLKIQLD